MIFMDLQPVDGAIWHMFRIQCFQIVVPTQ